MDLILRMATEIGVESIQPVFTSHGEVQLSAARLQRPSKTSGHCS